MRTARTNGKEIHSLFVGTSQSSSDAIDKNLAFMQVALSAIDAVQVPDKDPALQRKKEQALLFAGIGTASPQMAAGAMQLLFKFSITLSIGLAPLFILCLVFEQTKDLLFRRWLLYTIGTLFSMSLLSVVTEWVMELMANIAVLLWVNKALNGILGSAAEGLTTQAMFQGTLGNFMTYSAFAGKEQGKEKNSEAAAAPPRDVQPNATPPLPQTRYTGGRDGSDSITGQDKIKPTSRNGEENKMKNRHRPLNALSATLICLAFFSDFVYAEGACPSGYYQTTPQGVQGPTGCAPIPTNDTAATKWENKWGAIARGGDIVGISSNMKDEETAESEALADCHDNGGKSCSIQQTYSNQCVAIANSKSVLMRQNGKTKDEASAKALKECRAHTKGNKCWIYYAGCSLPVRAK